MIYGEPIFEECHSGKEIYKLSFSRFTVDEDGKKHPFPEPIMIVEEPHFEGKNFEYVVDKMLEEMRAYALKRLSEDERK